MPAAKILSEILFGFTVQQAKRPGQQKPHTTQHNVVRSGLNIIIGFISFRVFFASTN
jgi:hypothetical protein